MTLREDGGPAFPIPHQIIDANDPLFKFGSRGMSLRDYFAAMVLQGIHARDSYDSGQAFPEQRARLAYIEADEMLKARAK